MPPLINPRLVNSPFGDPGLFAPFFHKKRALLFDLGDISSLSPKEILKITHCFVSHTHMDHFIGFDHLLRIMLGREKVLHLYGPEGFHDNVAGKLSGYTWNLVDNYENPLTLVATEVLKDRRVTKRYECKSRFLPSGESIGESSGESNEALSSPVLHQEKAFRVEAVILEHDIPCLGFAVKEQFHVNIRKEMLGRMDLEPGKWLYDFKEMIHEGLPPETPVPVLCRKTGTYKTFELGDLTERLTLITRGRKIAYITDTSGTPGNVDRIVKLAGDCDHLFIEAAFLEKDRRLADAKKHLTAYQAGCIAGAANAGRFTMFHFSPRYEGKTDALYAEAMDGLRSGL